MTRTAENTAVAGARPLRPREFEQIRRLAYQSFGLDLKDGKEELVSARLQKILRAGAFRTFDDYCQHVRADRTGQALAAMIDALATNHTAFLREPEHFRFLQDRVAGELSGRDPINVWSAACSTGEEVWSLAFVLSDLLPNRQIRITGTDISNKALQRAQEAVYPFDRSTDLPPSWFSRFLTRESAQPALYRVTREMRAKARFQRLNLIEPFSWAKPFPIIFCRNVMIYFDKATQERVVKKLAASLEPGGYLFVGHAESLTGIKHSLEYIRPAVYQKPASRKEAR